MTVSHGCYNGSCMVFNLWRQSVAMAAEIPLDLMEGHYDPETPDIVARSSRLWITERMQKDLFRWLPIKWESLKPDILHVLLHHGDDSGTIEIKDLIPLANRLEKLIPLISDPYEWSDFKAVTQKFIDGLCLAASLDEVVEFS